MADLRAMSIVELQARRIAIRSMIDDYSDKPLVCELLWLRLTAIDCELWARQDAAERTPRRRMAAQS